MSGRIKLANSRNTVATHPNGPRPTQSVKTGSTHPNRGGGRGSSGGKGGK